MAEVTVKELAEVVRIPVDKLLQQLRDAGLDKQGESDSVSDQEKVQLLTHLQKGRGTVSRSTAADAGEDSSAPKTAATSTATSPEAATGGAADESAKPAASKNGAGTGTTTTATTTATAKPPLRRSASTLTARGSGRSSNVTVEVKRRRSRRPVEPTAEPTAEPAAESTASEDSSTIDASQIDELADSSADTGTQVSASDSADLSAVDSDPSTQNAELADDVDGNTLDTVASSSDAAPADPDQPELASRYAASADPEEIAQQELQRNQDEAREQQRKLREEANKQEALENARAEAEQQAMRQAAREKKRVDNEQLAREREEKQKAREAEAVQRRAALEAQEAARDKSTRKDGGGAAANAKGRGRRGGDAGGRSGGRNKLHVAHGKSGKRRGKEKRTVAANIESKHTFERPTEPVVRDVDVPDTITVAELANKMAVKAAEVIKAMMSMGVMATINQLLDQDTAILVVEEMGHRAVASSDDIETALTERLAVLVEGEQAGRPPVVTVMGHVDHGKTSLLDQIRESRIASGEAGGITQHIGAYHVETSNGVLTFLDTPGHAAFTAMRARGAQATDIVVLVVAADDGVMPQTIEGVQHARAAGVPIVVAVNKMDKEGADPERIKNELASHDVIPEDWGGDTPFVPVSALKGEGMDTLLETLALQAELLELKANPLGNASGLVIEASLDRGRGPVATVLVQNGTLQRGDTLICGQETGRVRALFDESGEQVESAGPSIPVQILGLSGVPNAGDEMLVAADERAARELAELRQGKERDLRLAGTRPAKLEDVFSQIKSGEIPMLNLVVKADVKGSFEAIRTSLEDLGTEEVSIRVVGGGVGGITESDANLAAASNAILVGFNVRADGAARKLISEHDIELRYYSVIYELIDLVKKVAGGMLAPEVKERIIGLAEVKDVFRSPKFGQVAGCMVVDGVVRREEPIRILRDSVVIHEGELDSLRRFKDDVSEVNMGTECGIGVKNYTDVKAGDHIEVFERTEVARSL